jgi:hypothetical protein
MHYVCKLQNTNSNIMNTQIMYKEAKFPLSEYVMATFAFGAKNVLF